MPAKLLATPEKVITVERMAEGRRPRMMARAMARPMIAPTKADAAETRIEIQNELTICGVPRSMMFCSVKLPFLSMKAPATRNSVGTIRNRTANRRKGTTPSASPQRMPAKSAEIGLRGAEAAASAEAGAARLPTMVSVLLDIGSDDRVPGLRDDILGR